MTSCGNGEGKQRGNWLQGRLVKEICVHFSLAQIFYYTPLYKINKFKIPIYEEQKNFCTNKVNKYLHIATMYLVCLQFDSLDEDQKSMLKMLRDTCLGESGADESKFPSVRTPL